MPGRSSREALRSSDSSRKEKRNGMTLTLDIKKCSGTKVKAMLIDCHVHVCACTPGHGKMSETLLKSLPFRFMQWKLGMSGSSEQTERSLERKLVETIDETTTLDAAVVLAFDGVFTKDGVFDDANTHLYVTNDYVIQLAAKYPKILFGASVHPY